MKKKLFGKESLFDFELKIFSQSYVYCRQLRGNHFAKFGIRKGTLLKLQKLQFIEFLY